MGVDRHDGHREGCQGFRPEDAAVVVVLLYCGGDHPGDADAVAAHQQHLFATTLIQYPGIHRFAVLGAELEDVADLDAAPDQQFAAAVRTGVTGDHVAKVGNFRHRAVALPVGAGEMEAVAIGAADEIGQCGGCPVGDHRQRQPDGTQGARATADGGANLGFRRHAQGAGHRHEFLCLDGVELVVSAQYQGDQLARLGALYHQGLDDALRSAAEKLAHLCNAVLLGCGNFTQRFLGGCALSGGCEGGSKFYVGRVIAAVGKGDGVFPGFREDVKFMGVAAADTAGVGQHGAKGESHAREDVGIGGMHAGVGVGEALFVEMKGVGVFHDEFARPHDPESGADLVAKLGLDLIEVDRQIAIAADLGAHQIGNDFLVRGAQAKRSAVAILDAQQLGSVLLPASRFPPQVTGLDHRHQYFLGAGGIHLFADDGFHLAQHPQPQRQPAVQAGGELADHAGAQHQLMADDLRFRGCLLERGQQHTGGAHGRSDSGSAWAGHSSRGSGERCRP